MARKPRDYKAEYQRRNELAKKNQFKTYGQVRYGLKKGTLARSNGRIVATPTKTSTNLKQWEKAGAKDPADYMKMKSEVKAWLKKYPGDGRSKLTADEIKNPEIMGAYHRAFVKRPTPPGSLKDFLVNVTHRVSKKEWDKNYAKRFKK